MNNTAARLERLPVGRFQYKLLMMGGLGYMFEAWDAGIIAFILPALRAQWQLTSLQVGYLASSTYVGFLVGALVAGAIGDRFGRKNVMLWALVLFCLASLVGAGLNDWHQFFAVRVIGGLGMGAEAAIIAPSCRNSSARSIAAGLPPHLRPFSPSASSFRPSSAISSYRPRRMAGAMRWSLPPCPSLSFCGGVAA